MMVHLEFEWTRELSVILASWIFGSWSMLVMPGNLWGSESFRAKNFVGLIAARKSSDENPDGLHLQESSV